MPKLILARRAVRVGPDEFVESVWVRPDSVERVEIAEGGLNLVLTEGRGVAFAKAEDLPRMHLKDGPRPVPGTAATIL